jgi:hypothetical protein
MAFDGGISASWRRNEAIPALPTELVSTMGTAALLNSSAMNQQLLGQMAATALTADSEIEKQKDYLEYYARENDLSRKEAERIRKDARRRGLVQGLGGLGSRMAGGQMGVSGNQMSFVGANDLLASLGTTLGLVNQLGTVGDASRYTTRPWAMIGGMGSGS